MRPDFALAINGVESTDTIRDRLMSIRVTDEAGMDSDGVVIALDDRDRRLAVPPTGAILDIALGYVGALGRMGLYTVDEIQLDGPPATLTITAHAADMRRSLKSPKTRSFDTIRRADLVSTIAGEHGLKPAVSTGLAAHVYPHLDQTNESDLHLLSRLAEECDAVAKPSNGFLVFAERGEAKSVSGKALAPITLAGPEITRYTMRNADRGRYNAVTARWHDFDPAETRSVTVGDGEPILTLSRKYPDQAAATAAATARLKRMRRGNAQLSLETPGRMDLFAETPLTVTGVRDGVNGDWIITRAEHSLKPGGYVCRVNA